MGAIEDMSLYYCLEIDKLKKDMIKEFESVGKAIFNAGQMIGALQRRVENVEKSIAND